MRIKLVIYFLLLTICRNASAQDSLITRIFNYSYNQQYNLADSILQANKTNINELYFAVLEIDMSYWKNVNSAETQNYKAFEKTLLKYENKTAETLTQKGIQLIKFSYQLRYELKRYRFIDASFTQIKTKAIFDELTNDAQIKTCDEQELFQLYNNMFLYFENHWKTFAGKKAEKNCQLALLNMERLANSDEKIVKTLTSYFLARTYMRFEKAPQKGIPYFKTLINLYPQNKVFPALLTECNHS